MGFYVPLQIVTFLVGSLLHFTHPSKGNHDSFKIIDILSTVNESVWEHMKMFIVGSFIVTLVYIIPSSGALGDALIVSAISTCIAVALIPLLFYGYRLFVSNDVLLFDIAIFYTASYAFDRLFNHFTPLQIHIPTLSMVFFGILLWSFIILIIAYWTYNPPKLEMFRCPERNCYGHPKEEETKIDDKVVIMKPVRKELPMIKAILAQWTDIDEADKYIERMKDEIEGSTRYNMKFWVIKEDGKVIGVSGIGDPYPKLSKYAKTDNPGLIKILYLDHRYRGKGHGKALLNEMIAKARHSGYSEILIGSHSRYKTTAYDFYLKMGFEVVGRNKGKQKDDYMEVFGMVV